MTAISFEELSSIREKFLDKKIVFCSGSFDLTHLGHILFFEGCKNLGDLLVVSIGGDNLVKELKGENRPVLDQSIRLKTIDSLKPVDYCFLDTISDASNTLYGLDLAFEKLKPDVYVINQDAFNLDYRKNLCKKFRVKLVILERVFPLSTTDIINKIKKAYSFS